MKILIDTNIVIDALASREPWNESAEKIFLMAANNIVDMYITASSATDIYYLIRKHLHNTEIAKQIMGKLYSLAGILEVKEEDLVEALASPIADYEDAVVEQVARRSDMECIVTRNEKDYEAGLTQIFSPKDIIRFMEQEK
ncbi:MAG: PIN domain-containing protein [Lachnospiraceae bacterium]|nr:PIN domain-containing protein [Lachnospiraceae bacterium]